MVQVKPETIEYLPFIRQAWNIVKGETDPAFDESHTDHQQTLIYKAENVLKTGSAGDDAFSIAFRNLWRPPAVPREVDAELPSDAVPESAEESPVVEESTRAETAEEEPAPKKGKKK